MKSSFSGHIAEIPYISVDNFENTTKSAYFLSHYHRDHFFGLNCTFLPEALKENGAFIYASEVTIAIIKNDQRRELIPYLKVLKLGRDTITLKNKNGADIYLNVTTLPAGHCIGSVMFLFSNEKTILYTGDFRITANDITKYTHLHTKNRDPIHINTLYMDTTFQNVPYFPRRSEVISTVVTRVRDWLNLDERNVVYLKTSANYGYECLCNAIYDAIGVKSYLGQTKWRIFSQFPKEMHGITNNPNSRIQLGYFKNSKELRLPKEHEKILTIYFSARSWVNENKDEDFIKIIHDNSLDVCFSLHCGRDELLYLVNYFQPKKVVGFPLPLNRSSPVKMASEISSLKIEISNSSKRMRRESDDDVAVSKKINRDVVKTMFNW